MFNYSKFFIKSDAPVNLQIYSGRLLQFSVKKERELKFEMTDISKFQNIVNI